MPPDSALCNPILRRKRFGFKERGAAWTWELYQDPLADDVGVLGGSAVMFCQHIGIPYIRFRAAVRPASLLPPRAFGGASH